MTDWNHRDEWARRGAGFSVVVSRHEVALYDEGPHRWAVYAYIHPKHPHFAKFGGGDMWQDAAGVMPLHGGPTYLRRHHGDDGATTAYQVGADYGHIGDDEFSRMATREDARDVFRDADALFTWLDDRKAA